MSNEIYHVCGTGPSRDDTSTNTTCCKCGQVIHYADDKPADAISICLACVKKDVSERKGNVQFEVTEETLGKVLERAGIPNTAETRAALRETALKKVRETLTDPWD